MLLNRARRALATASAFAFVALATAPAYAAGSNMPWEQPLNQILEFDPRSRRQGHLGDRHHRHRPDTGVW